MQIGELVRDGVISIKTGPFGTQLKAAEYQKSGTPVLNVKNLGYGSISKAKLDYVGSDTVDRLSIHLLKKGDIVFGRKGAVDRHAFIDKESDGWMQGSDCIRMRIESDVINPKFLSYYFLTNQHKAFMISMCSHGTTMASLNQKILEQIEIPYPERQYQDRVVDMLEWFDKKIKVNGKINENLLQQATTIFDNALRRSESVSYADLGTLGDVRGGKRLPKGVNLITEPNSHPYIRVRDLNNVVFASLSADYEYVDDETQKSISRYITAAGDVLISIVGTIGLTAIVDKSLDNANLTENCVKVTNLASITPEYLLLYLRQC